MNFDGRGREPSGEVLIVHIEHEIHASSNAGMPI